ncbi:unnamed protein product, partial [Laminaria digitata]
LNAGQLLAIHNVRFMNRLLEAVRDAIEADNYAAAWKFWVEG